MSQETTMFEQPSPDELDALIAARLSGTPLPAGASRRRNSAARLRHWG